MEKKPSMLTPINNKSLVQKVIDRITDAIVEGEIRPGDKLPTEMELVSAFQVGRNTVREAIRVLSAYGVVEIRRPEGTFVCDGFSDNLLNPMIYGIILQKDRSYQDLIGLRRIIEDGIMQLIVERGLHETELENLERLCNDLTNKIWQDPPDVELVLEADMAFHNEVARVTGNSLVIKIHDVVVNLTRASRRRTIQHIFEKNDQGYLASTHQELLHALHGTDMSALHQAISNSYFYWKDSYKW